MRKTPKYLREAPPGPESFSVFFGLWWIGAEGPKCEWALGPGVWRRLQEKGWATPGPLDWRGEPTLAITEAGRTAYVELERLRERGISKIQRDRSTQ